MKKLIDKLHQEQILSAEEFRTLLTDRSEETDLYARELADQVRQQVYGNQIYVRGLIEFTNYCKNDCYYCGIRRSNRNAQRYRLTEEDILACCKEGYELGFRTFVLQGGEDGYYTDEKLTALIRKIKEVYPEKSSRNSQMLSRKAWNMSRLTPRKKSRKSLHHSLQKLTSTQLRLS